MGHCQSEGLQGCHALKTSSSAVRQPCWHCSGQVKYVKQRSSLSRSHPLPGGQLLWVWRCLWHTSAMGMMMWVLVWEVLQHSDSGTMCRFSHWQTTSSMALLMPGQKRLPHASNCDFVIPWWKWSSWCRTLSLSAGGMMSASPCRTRPSLMVRVSLCCQYGWRGWGTTLMSLGQPVTMRSC